MTALASFAAQPATQPAAQPAPLPTLAEVRALSRAHDLTGAERACRAILRARPDDPDALHQLGEITLRTGAPGLAVALLRRAAARAPERAAYRLTLGAALRDRGQPEEAESVLREALAVAPRDTQLLASLSLTLMERGRITAALRTLRDALAIEPQSAQIHQTLGVVQVVAGLGQQAVASFRRATALDPGSASAHSGVLFAQHYVPGVTRTAASAEARAWAGRHADPLTAVARRGGHPNLPDPDRRIRVGYVSGDFRGHPVGRILESVLPAHDTARVEVYCYSNHWRADSVTQRLRAAAAEWRTIAHLSDAAAADLIRADGIDLLVDLSGHTGANRLLVAARRPAPVQAMWLGYFDTTGMAAMDYVVGDARVCPVGDDAEYVERVARLDRSFVCFTPPAGGPEVGSLPATGRGHVTFGCLNNVAKITPQAIALWATLLRALPGSRLILKSVPLADAEVRRRYRRLFAQHGITSERLDLRGGSDYAAHMATYQEIDVALDTFPYNGGATTLDALWMGVPVVTLAGDRFVGRMGLSILATAGLERWVASSPEEYVRLALALASDQEALACTRASLRPAVLDSPICDGAGLARDLERLYRAMWREWCLRSERSASGA